jgi:hypothetical protein
VGKYEDGDNYKHNLINKGLVKKDGNIWSFGGQRNGMLLYQIEPDGKRTTIAGSSINSNKMKDGKGVDAWITTKARIIKELPDGSVLFTDGGYQVMHESFPDLKETSNIWRMILPNGEIKTITDANGKPIIKRFFSNIIVDKKGYWYYSNDYEIIKFKPELVIDSFITVAKSTYKNDANSEYELTKTAGRKKWAMGKLGVASFPGIANIAWGPDGEIYFYSTASNRFAVIKNGMVSHYTGNSDFTNWYAGISMGANCSGKKDGNATTAQICGVHSMVWINNKMVVINATTVTNQENGKSRSSFIKTYIDKNGNVNSLPAGQN